MVNACPTDGGCVLAIVGSRTLGVNVRDVDSVIREVLAAHNPMLVITTADHGVCARVVAMCAEQSIPCFPYKAEQKPPSEHTGNWFRDSGTRDRNARVAADCQHLVRIYYRSTKTHGSHWTRDHAESLGRWTDEIAYGPAPA